MTMRLYILILLTQLTIVTVYADIDRDTERRCFEIGGFFDETDGYCNMEHPDIRFLIDNNSTKEAK